ncbi:MAG: phosphoribosylglycinamide formyltransferase [Dehalococcoidia bacterium]|nr:phosphoribosylglycinamide formyltransferase [Dehalococcoidia bacterium]
MRILRLGFLASHGGSNMQAIIDACKDGRLDAEPAVVISNNSESTALERARREGIPNYHLSSATHRDPAELDAAILRTLEEHGVDLVILAGYMKLLGPRTLARYRGRILNIHPALLPKFGGKGLYGKKVHEAVLAAGERVTGVTIHLVDERYDAGPIVAQSEVPVLEGDTVDSLAARVLEREHQLFAETLQKIAVGEIDLDAIDK